MTDRHSKNVDVQAIWIGAIVVVATCAFLYILFDGARSLR